MRRSLLVTLLGGSLAVLLALAAPALSLKPYVPKPQDFELSPPSSAAAVAARSGEFRYASRPLRAPKRFNVVGLRWRAPSREVHLSLRVRSAVTGRWGRWREFSGDPTDGPDPRRGEPTRGGMSAPVWAGEADAVQYRSSHRLRGVRLHFVNSTGSATPTDRVRTALRRATGRGVMAVAGLVSARAAGSQPAMVTRAQWGADQYCIPRGTPSYGEVRAAFVHHTVTANEYTREQAPAAVLGICRYHRNSNGWDDIGYNFVVDKYGTIYEGRAGGVDQPVVGAQAQGFNAQSTGISNLGTHSTVPQTDAALDAIARIIRWKLPIHGAPTYGTAELTSAGGATNRFPAGTVVTLERISGHRDGNNTSCPGDALYAQLPGLRERTGRHEGIGSPVKAPARVTIGPRRARVPYGQAQELTGTISPAKPVVRIVVEKKVGRRYRRLGSLRARSASGRYARRYRPKTTGMFRFSAAYPGDAQTLPAVARPAYLRTVAPTGGTVARRR